MCIGDRLRYMHIVVYFSFPLSTLRKFGEHIVKAIGLSEPEVSETT